jgi:hypothetical protein
MLVFFALFVSAVVARAQTGGTQDIWIISSRIAEKKNRQHGLKMPYVMKTAFFLSKQKPHSIILRYGEVIAMDGSLHTTNDS